LKRQKLKILQEKLNGQPSATTAKASKVRNRQYCKTGNLHTILIFDKRGPPAWYLGVSQKSIACKN